MKRNRIASAAFAGLAAAAAAATPASAAPLALTAANTDFTGPTLTSVTLNGTTYPTSSLARVSVTAFASASASVLYVKDVGTSVSGTTVSIGAQQRRDLIETDWEGDTGWANAGATTGITGTFQVPVFNGPGPDFILFETQTSATVDQLAVSFNGGTATALSTTVGWGDTGADTNNGDVLTHRNSGNTADVTVTSLSVLLNNSTIVTGGATSMAINQGIYGTALDFSDYGVAPGAQVTTFSVTSPNNSADPTIIAAVVPEPGGAATVAAAAAGLLGARRRRRRSRGVTSPRL